MPAPVGRSEGATLTHVAIYECRNCRLFGKAWLGPMVTCGGGHMREGGALVSAPDRCGRPLVLSIYGKTFS